MGNAWHRVVEANPSNGRERIPVMGRRNDNAISEC